MIRKYSLISTFVTALMLSVSASAVDYRARAGLGVGDYDLDVEVKDGSNSSITETATLKPFVVGATAVFDRFYMDLEFRTSDTSAEDSDDLKRTDLNLTVGFPFTNNIVAFVGVKSGKSEFTASDSVTSSETTFESKGIFGGAA